MKIVNADNGKLLGTLVCDQPGSLVWQPRNSDETITFPANRLGDWLQSIKGTCDNVAATVRFRPAPTPSGMDPLDVSEIFRLPRKRGEATRSFQVQK